MKNNNYRNIHPFPARMAPEIAIQALGNLNVGDVVLDPMVGSGTVLHHATLDGFTALGFDLDPLAILMTKVRTSKINVKKYDSIVLTIFDELKKIRLVDVKLSWIDNDLETQSFIKFWFAKKQSNDLRKIAFLLSNYKKKNNCVELDALRIALSRIIITKKIGASLAWDISHSRPHKVKKENDFDVVDGFSNSVKAVRKLLELNLTVKHQSKIKLGDARNMKLPNESVDKVITSPPYLNAIDYMRGHKFSLVWLGYTISELREIRSGAIGVEKKISMANNQNKIDKIFNTIVADSNLKDQQKGMIKRYIQDSISLMAEISRVLKKGKQATLVVGNSTLNNNNIENSEIFKYAGALSGLNTLNEIKREIPLSKRYLPLPKSISNSLGKRMKHEVILTFEKPLSTPTGSIIH